MDFMDFIWGFIVMIWVVGSSLRLPLELWRSNRMRPVSAAQNARPAPGRSFCGGAELEIRGLKKVQILCQESRHLYHHDPSCTSLWWFGFAATIFGDNEWMRFKTDKTSQDVKNLAFHCPFHSPLKTHTHASMKVGYTHHMPIILTRIDAQLDFDQFHGRGVIWFNQKFNLYNIIS